MPRGSRTELKKAATAKAMSEMGYQDGQISHAVGIPRQTVDDIINGKHGWGDIIQNDDVFRRFRTEQKRILHAGSLEVARKALKRVDETVDTASPAQAAMIYGIMRDKERLDAGEPTEIHAEYNFESVNRLNEIIGKLRAAREERKRLETEGSNEAEVIGSISDTCQDLTQINLRIPSQSGPA